MTNEEAIKDIKENILPIVGGKSLLMAIAALGKDTNVPTNDGKTLVVKIPKEYLDTTARVILDCDPWCKTFYEDAPGEAHWVKHETFDDGETYECDHCGVEWQFNDGGPEENEAFFCPKCGFKMALKGEIDGQTD